MAIKSKKRLVSLCSNPKSSTSVVSLIRFKERTNEELCNIIATNPKKEASKWAEELNITAAKVAGIRRSITCKKARTKEEAKAKAKTKPALVDWSKREKKEIGRKKYVKGVKESGIYNGEILTLSAHDGITEQKLLNEVSNKFHFTSYEFGKKGEYPALVKLVAEKNLPFSIIQDKISYGIYRAKENDFSHMNLDYCGKYETFREEFEYALVNRIMKNKGVCSVTFSYGRKSGYLGLEGIVKSVIDFIKKIGGYEFVEYYDYCEDKTEEHPKGSTMVQIIIKRTE